jgi:hypothetical protein
LPGKSVLWQQLEALSFGRLARRDYLKAPAVQGGDPVHVKLLGKRDHAGINGLEP